MFEVSVTMDNYKTHTQPIFRWKNVIFVIDYLKGDSAD